MVSIRHAFQSEKTDDPAASADGQITPSRWNADLDTEMATARILGRNTAGTGAIEELDAATTRSLLQLVKGTGAGEIPVLDGSGKLDTSILPALAITETFVVNSQAAMLALDAQTGDVAIRTDLSKTFILSTNNPGTLADWKEMLTPTDAVLSVAGLTGAISASALKTALALAAADITDASANGRSLIKAADYAAMRTLLSLDVGINVQAFSSLLAAIAGLTPTNGNVITGNGITWTSAAPSSGALPTMIVRDEKAQGTEGGSAVSNTWIQRDLNTVGVNTISSASLSSNQIILPIGTYDINAAVSGYKINNHRARLYNVTDGLVAVDGISSYSANADSTSSQSEIIGRFTIAAQKTFRIEHFTKFGASANGLGAAVGAGPEVYTICRLTKVA